MEIQLTSFKKELHNYIPLDILINVVKMYVPAGQIPNVDVPSFHYMARRPDSITGGIFLETCSTANVL